MRKREKPVFARLRKQVMYLKLVNNINAQKLIFCFKLYSLQREDQKMEAKHGL